MAFASSLLIVLHLAAEPVFQAETIFAFDPIHNHCSSIVETGGGDLLACWFHGSGERWADDVVIQGSRKRAGEASWSEPFVMVDTQLFPDCHPVLFIDPRGKLWMFWIVVQNNEWGGALLQYRTAAKYQEDGPPQWDWQDVIHVRLEDAETTFSAVIEQAKQEYGALVTGIPRLQKSFDEAIAASRDKLRQRLGWTPRLHPIMLPDNRIMLGLYHDVFNCSLAAFTSDWGGTWEFSAPIVDAEVGNIQPAFLRKKDGSLVAFMRDNGLPQKIRVAASTDNGKTWGDVTTTDIPNPHTSIDCISVASGNWVLVCNDVRKGRHVLSAYLSDDEGASWKWRRRLENFEPEQGTASYPAVIQAADGSVHCTYSYTDKRFEGSTIKHAAFNEEWIKAGNES